MASSDANLWHNAMDTEIHSMYSHGVWTLIASPEGIKSVGPSWIHLKSCLDGNVETFRARLVAMGYALKEGIVFRCVLLLGCHACNHSDSPVHFYYIDL